MGKASCKVINKACRLVNKMESISLVLKAYDTAISNNDFNKAEKLIKTLEILLEQCLVMLDTQEVQI